MKYFFGIFITLATLGNNAQGQMQRTQKGVLYQIFPSTPGVKIKENDIITFHFIQKTDKDSVLASSYTMGHPVQTQIRPTQNAGDLMDIFPLMSVNDSAVVKVPVDSIFKGHEDQRPAFFKKGGYLTFNLKITKIQTLEQAMAEIKTAETTGAAQYITNHKLVLKTTPSGLMYVITQPSSGLKPLKGDTLLVNYAGRTLNDKVFDSSIESIAKGAGLQQPGRTYEPIQVIVGTGAVIPGWDEGLLLLNQGSKATFIIPSSLAYGDHGSGDDIKPYSTLVFDVELVKVKPVKHASAAAPAKAPVHHTAVHKKA